MFAAVALGACVFELVTPGDTRIAAQVVSGVGFWARALSYAAGRMCMG